MPVAVDKLIIVGILVIFIGLCISYGVSICSHSKCKRDDSDSDSEDEKEGFTNPVSETTAPTRASDCRCLPGYIPSNTVPKKILGYENGFIEVKSPLKVRYGSDNRWVEKMVYNTFKATNSFFGKDPAPGVRKQVETVAGSDFFFCQSLSEQTQTRSCY